MEQDRTLTVGAAPFINGHSNLQLQVGAAPFIKGATLQLEPHIHTTTTKVEIIIKSELSHCNSAIDLNVCNEALQAVM